MYHGAHEPPKSKRPAILATLAALALVAGAAFVWPHSTTPAADSMNLSVAQECQQALGYPARTNADKTWLRTCVHALTPPTVSPSGTPTPPPSPSASPTPTMTTPPPTTTTPPVTTPPTTTPPPTTLPPTTTPPGSCPVAGTNVPGAADPWGGCWPGPGNTGVPAGVTLTAYTGPCTITAANTVIDSKTVTCATLDIRAAGVVIRNSLLDGTDVVDDNLASASFSITDSTVMNGAREQCSCIGGHDMIVLRVNDVGGNRGMYCELRCVITDSWSHGRLLQGAQHGSGIREEQFTTITHSAFACDYPIVDDTTGLGCSADLTGYPDFAPIHDNTIQRNLLLASPTDSFCAYGGATGGKPFSGDPANATNQKFIENVFQRGANGRCGDFGPITDFDTSRPGNVFTGNKFDDGSPVVAA